MGERRWVVLMGERRCVRGWVRGWVLMGERDVLEWIGI